MKNLKTVLSVLAFAAAAIGLIAAVVYFLDRKFGFLGCADEDIEDVDYIGEEYYAEDLAVEPETVEEIPAEQPAAEEQA